MNRGEFWIGLERERERRNEGKSEKEREGNARVREREGTERGSKGEGGRKIEQQKRTEGRRRR